MLLLVFAFNFVWRHPPLIGPALNPTPHKAAGRVICSMQCAP